MAQMRECLAPLAFLCLFHIVDGATFGTSLRSLTSRVQGRSILLLVWSAFFAGMPLFMYLQSDWPWWAYATQAGALFGSAALSFFLADTLSDLLRRGYIVTVGLGGVFMVVGAGLAASRVVAEGFPLGLLMGSTFFLVGLATFVAGCRDWRKENAE